MNKIKIKVFWKQDASPIGIFMNIEDAKKLKKYYHGVKYFKFNDPYYLHNTHYDENYKNFVKDILGCNIDNVVIVFEIGCNRSNKYCECTYTDEIWDIDDINIVYKKEDILIPDIITDQDGYSEIGSFVINT